MPEMTDLTSPEASGGAGPFFEQHVDAALLALLLAGGTPPFLRDCRLEAVHLQAGHLGWRTDDVLLVGCDGAGALRNAAVQVKRKFTIAASDKDCVSTVSRAWLDYRNEGLFHSGRDVLGIVAGRASLELLSGFRSLLDCARASADKADFEHRLATHGYLSETTRKFERIIATIVEEANGGTVSREDFIGFLRALDFTCLDLLTPGSYAEALIRSLLALSTMEPDRVRVANETWSELLRLVSLGSPTARSFRRGDLPATLLSRHGSPAGPDALTLAALREMTRVVALGVNARIGDYHLTRSDVEQQLLSLLESHRIVLVTGEAGIGKSAVALGAFDAICTDTFGIALRAGMLAASHLNEALSPHGLTIQRLSAVTALHARKVAWVESGERLLEKQESEREAFGDLLRLLGPDPGWKLIITCRDYSVETFRTAFLDSMGMTCAVLRVPPLSDNELMEVQTRYPQLAKPLSSTSLRSLLRNPFFLSRARSMNWSSDVLLPEDERAFRVKAWREVIRREDEADGGMPQLRGETFMNLAVRRARALDPFVPCHDLNAAAVQRLKRDTLVMVKPDDDNQIAPAHDVLEDWALIQWLTQEFQECDRNWRAFFERIGTHPAIRRAFRKWLTETLSTTPQEADGHVLGIVCDRSIPAHWQDDTLVATLLSSDANAFLRRNRTVLLEEGAKLLRRVLHLIQVACKRAPDRLRDHPAAGVHFLEPAGCAWSGAAEALDAGAEHFTPADLFLQLQFLEDWCRGVTWLTPYPPGAAHIGRVALRLLSCADGLHYSARDDVVERLLKVLLRIPKVVEPELRRIVDECLAETRLDLEERVLVRLLFNYFHGYAVCRDLPDITVTVANHVLGLSHMEDEEQLEERRYGGLQEVEEAFGVPPSLHFEGFPPSSYHGPYLGLLLHHPAVGLDLVLRFVNHACDAYANPANRLEFVEPPVEVELELPDGTKHRQWGGWRLWGLYRGATVGPSTLQSALMALEEWLLQKAEQNDPSLPNVLTDLLRQSNNVAVTAVVASVATAFPRRAGPATVSLLTCPSFLEWDLARPMADPGHRLTVLAEMMPAPRPEQSLYEAERKESAKRAHRQHHLEHLAVMLQTTPLRDAVWRVLDRYKAQLPLEHEQNDQDRLWRLKLHRIDIRNFQMAGRTDDGGVVYQPAAPPSDVQQMLDRTQPHLDEVQNTLGLQMWAISVWEGKNEGTYRPEDWREKLLAARQLPPPQRGDEEVFLAADRIESYVAAVCVRDHWQEMTEDEQAWCVEMVCGAVSRHADTEDRLLTRGRNSMDGSRAAARVLPSLLSKDLEERLRVRLLAALSRGVLHSVEEVAQMTAHGVGTYLWRTDPRLALSCVQALLTQAGLLHQFHEDQRKKPFSEREPDTGFQQEVRARVREMIEQRAACDSAALLAVDYRRWPWSTILPRLLAIFGKQYEDTIARQFFARLAELLCLSWRGERGRRRLHPDSDADDARFEGMLEYHVEEWLAHFALATGPVVSLDFCAPLAAASKDYPEQAADFLRQLVIAEDSRHTGETFWLLWQQFADTFLSSGLPSKLDREYSAAAKLLRVLFLDLTWKPETRDWQPLHGQEHRLMDLFRRLPASREAISAFTHFLAKIGGRLLPEALTLISEKLHAPGSGELLAGNGAYWLELILARLVYGGMPRIRTERQLRSSTLHILDQLVECGSSAAYKLRDDFVTPLRG